MRAKNARFIFYGDFHVPAEGPQRRVAVQISTLESGEINYEELKTALIANQGKPAVLNLNIGTTVKGAVDDVDRVLEVLKVRKDIQSDLEDFPYWHGTGFRTNLAG